MACVPREKCSPATMATWFTENFKLTGKYICAVAIVKDTDYSIPERVLDNLFDFNMTNPYDIVRLGDSAGCNVNDALVEVKSILDNANEKYNRWADLKLVPEIAVLRPNSRIFRTQWDALWKACSYEYGKNECIDSIMVGFIWSIVHGVLYLICSAIVLFITYPALFIYDMTCGGLYKQLTVLIDDNVATGFYVTNKAIDDEILTAMATLAKKLSSRSRPVSVSRSQCIYLNKESRTDGDDELVKHTADCFFLTLALTPCDPLI